MRKLLSTVAAAFLMCTANAHASPMTLNVRELDLRQAIMLVASNGRLNVSVDDSVKGTTSIRLNDVEPERALEIIVKTNGLNLIRDGNIYIVTKNIYKGVVMKSYVLPIKFGDPEALLNAVASTLNIELDDKDDGNQEERDIVKSAADEDRKRYEDQDNRRKDRILINKEINALVLFGTEAEYERAKSLLADLDVELKQVSVEAKILAIDKSASKNLGVEWSWSTVPQFPDRSLEINQPTYNSNGTIRNEGYILEEYSRKSNDNTGYGIIQFGRGPAGIPFEFYYGAQINALVANGKAKILSRPNVTTIQGHEAVINVGSSVPVPRESITNSTTTTSIEYRDAGIILRYTPRINADGTITATIHTEVSTPQYVPDLKVYQFNTRSADTTVTVRDGEPMVIGGLIGAEEAKSISKIPFLGDLPILGALFRNHRKSKSESELMIFITAHVLKGAGSN